MHVDAVRFDLARAKQMGLVLPDVIEPKLAGGAVEMARELRNRL
jgi:hypothetical protein